MPQDPQHQPPGLKPAELEAYDRARATIANHESGEWEHTGDALAGARTVMVALEELGERRELAEDPLGIRRILRAPAVRRLADAAADLRGELELTPADVAPLDDRGRADAARELVDDALRTALEHNPDDVEAIGLESLVKAYAILADRVPVDVEPPAPDPRLERLARLEARASIAVESVQAPGIHRDHFTGVLEPVLDALEALGEELGR